MSARRRKVLFLFPFPHLGGGGGAQRVLSTLLRYLNHERFELHLALLNAQRGEGDEIPEGLTVHDLNYTRVRYALPTLVRLIRSLKPDVVLSNIGHMNLALLLSRPFLPRSARVLIGESTTLSAYLKQTTRYPRIWTSLYRLLYRHADRIVCLSDAMKSELANRFSVPEGKLVRIYNPVDVDRILMLSEHQGSPYTAKGPNLVVAGRFVREKGIDLLFGALPLVLERYPEANLTVLGEGPLEQELKEQAEKLGVGQAISFLGLQQNPWRYFRHADLVVVPSRVDGLPYVPLEAIAVGTPVVATDCPGAIREVHAIESGITLAPPEDSQALGYVIIATLQQPRATLIPRPARLGSFNLQHAVDEYSRLLDDCQARLPQPNAPL